MEIFIIKTFFHIERINCSIKRSNQSYELHLLFWFLFFVFIITLLSVAFSRTLSWYQFCRMHQLFKDFTHLCCFPLHANANLFVADIDGSLTVFFYLHDISLKASVFIKPNYEIIPCFLNEVHSHPFYLIIEQEYQCFLLFLSF